jgi:hypothetical protein
MSRRDGWIFVDVLVALGLLAVVLGCLVPSIAGLSGSEVAQETRIFSSIEPARYDPWANFR